MKKKIPYILDTLFLAFVFAAVKSVRVYAYIDPSVMTYAIQAVAGIVITLGAVLGVYFRRIKKKIGKADGSEGKEAESDEIIVKSETEDG